MHPSISSALLLMLLTGTQALTDVLLGRYGENSAVDASQIAQYTPIRFV